MTGGKGGREAADQVVLQVFVTYSIRLVRGSLVGWSGRLWGSGGLLPGRGWRMLGWLPVAGLGLSAAGGFSSGWGVRGG
jgi:hypothetical protein